MMMIHYDIIFLGHNYGLAELQNGLSCYQTRRTRYIWQTVDKNMLNYFTHSLEMADFLPEFSIRYLFPTSLFPDKSGKYPAKQKIHSN